MQQSQPPQTALPYFNIGAYINKVSQSRPCTRQLQTIEEPHTRNVPTIFTFLGVCGTEKGCLLPWVSNFKIPVPTRPIQDLLVFSFCGCHWPQTLQPFNIISSKSLQQQPEPHSVTLKKKAALS